MKKILSVLSICLVILTSFLLTGCGEKSEATNVMTMEVNPSVQLVLDQNNKVISAVSLNADGEKVLASTTFTGKTAEEAAKLFAEISTELGKIDVNTNGTTLTINISCEEETAKIKELKSSVQNSVNNYFKENGILAGAKVLNKDIKDTLTALSVEVEDLTTASYNELINLVNETSSNLENISYSLRNEVTSAINLLKNTYQKTISTTKETIENLEKLLNSSSIPQSIKDTYNTQLKEAKASLENYLKELDQKIEAEVAKFEQQSETLIANVRTEVNNMINEGKTIINNHKNEFLKNKDEILAEIENFQNSL